MSRSPLIRSLTARAPKASRPRRAAAVVLGLFLAFAGTSHLTFARDEFQAQVPDWVPLDKDTVVLLSGVAEIGLGSALALLPGRRIPVGLAAAAFFIAIFPGNISQYVTQTDGFGLDTDQKRLIRLFFQPLLVVWALWSTGAWRAIRNRRQR
ncbi:MULTISPECIES: DoxX family protein [Arthrobacter]|uniref:DoxX family protein n=1 Tax=Arthrobacter TaxID=1663 RepID=UPI003826BD3B